MVQTKRRKHRSTPGHFRTNSANYNGVLATKLQPTEQSFIRTYQIKWTRTLSTSALFGNLTSLWKLRKSLTELHTTVITLPSEQSSTMPHRITKLTAAKRKQGRKAVLPHSILMIYLSIIHRDLTGYFIRVVLLPMVHWKSTRSVLSLAVVT